MQNESPPRFLLRKTPSIQREPAVPVAVALGLGIAVDRVCGCPIALWWGLCVALLIASVACHCGAGCGNGTRWHRLGAGGILLMAVGAFGGGWHHLYWSVVSADEVAAYTMPQPQPIELIGKVDSEPSISPRKESELPSAIPRYDRTVFSLRAEEIAGVRAPTPTAGRVWVDVQGHLLGVHSGDEIRVLGRISRPSSASNPGGFDFREYLRRDGIHSVLRVERPEAVTLLHAQESWSAGMRRAALARCRRLIRDGLSERTAGLGEALLLGTRSDVPEDMRTAFIRSGTMHMLAISGLHVGILAAFLWGLCRICGVERKPSMLLIASVLVAYAILTEARPPVVRATLLTLLWLAGEASGRVSSLANHLAVAAMAVMLWNPTYLFDIGPQLSFLAVLGLIWSGTLDPDAEAESPENELVDESWWWWVPITRLGKALRKAYVATAAIWLFTLPLTMAYFHIVSVVGFFVNVLLIPWLALTLCMGYAMLLTGLTLPVLSGPFAWAFDRGLLVLVEVIDWSAGLPAAYWNVPAPENWWLIGFYSLLGCLAISPRASLFCRASVRALLAWTVIGLTIAALPAPAGLRCTFLAVGHGCAILVELPNGETLLYDAGSLQDPERAVQIVRDTLTRRGRTRINALMISHADIDHFNAAYGLVNAVPVEQVLLAPSFLDFNQPSVTGFCEQVSAAGVPIRLVGADDRLRTSGAVTMTILHPGPRSQIEEDNANSLVLRIDYAGRTILLTGDLEGPGLEALLSQPPISCDVMLSPHHGSRAANPESLAAWASPDWVIISGGRGNTSDSLADVYGSDTTRLSTMTDGAITFTITPDGDIRCDTMRNETASSAGNLSNDMDNATD